MTELKAKITFSINPYVKQEDEPQELAKKGMLAMFEVRYKNRKGNWPILSGYWVGDMQEVVMHPLFSRNGRTEVRLSREEYYALIDGAEVVADRFRPADFGEIEIVAARAYLKKCNP